MINLASKRLRVEIAEPGEAPNVTTRFDRAGFVTEIVLDGSYRFCASEPRNLCHPSTGGRGLCNEYMLDVSQEAAMGERFPKFGVGLFPRLYEGRYRIIQDYPEIQPFPITVRSMDTQAAFETHPVPCLGYALNTVKTISVLENELRMTVSAKNTGDKPLLIDEYCHNFLSIDGMALGSDYRLIMPSIPDLGHDRLKNMCGENGSLRGFGHGFTFCEMSAVASDYLIPGSELSAEQRFTWTLMHTGAGAVVSAETDFVPGKVSVWAVDHLVCPEAFFTRTLLPNEACEWTRRWRFETVEEYERRKLA